MLYGPPRHRALAEHLLRLMELRDPSARRNGIKMPHIGMVEPTEALERFFVVSETAAVVPLPSFHGAEGFDCGVLLSREAAVSLVHHGREACASARQVETIEAVRARCRYGTTKGRGRSVIEDLQQVAGARTASVLQLAQELFRRPSRAAIDDYGPVLGVLEDWLAARELPHRRLHDATGTLVGLLVEIPGGRS
ncbi:hypothetical protein ACWC3X_40090, partial [Streptomyces populi]